jgi:cytochrome b6-f complex iron-sulfur subunit
VTDVSRRTVLAGGAVVTGGVALAACSASVRSGATATSAGASATSAGSARSATGVTLAKLADIPVGQAVAASLPDGKPVVVARPTADTAAAFSAICTHQGCTVAPAGDQLHCPCHGSVYNATTGAVLHGPAPRSLASVPVTATNGAVITA